METKVNVKLASVAIDFFIMRSLTDLLSGPHKPAGLQNVHLRQLHAASNDGAPPGLSQ